MLPIANIALFLIVFQVRARCVPGACESSRDMTRAVAAWLPQVLVCVGSFCMCLKRKDHDVLPPPEAFVDKRYEKYRFDPEEPKVEPGAAAVAAAAIPT